MRPTPLRPLGKEKCGICIRRVAAGNSRLCARCGKIYRYLDSLSGFVKRGRPFSGRFSCSAAEERVGAILTLLFPEEKIWNGYRPTWCLSEKGAPLEFDFLLEQKKILIEFNGSQHYLPSPWFDGARRAKARLAERARRDALKARKARLNGFRLVVISFREKLTANNILVLIERETVENRELAP